jgi:hypothetical protein
MLVPGRIYSMELDIGYIDKVIKLIIVIVLLINILSFLGTLWNGRYICAFHFWLFLGIVSSDIRGTSLTVV